MQIEQLFSMGRYLNVIVENKNSSMTVDINKKSTYVFLFQRKHNVVICVMSRINLRYSTSLKSASTRTVCSQTVCSWPLTRQCSMLLQTSVLCVNVFNPPSVHSLQSLGIQVTTYIPKAIITIIIFRRLMGSTLAIFLHSAPWLI